MTVPWLGKNALKFDATIAVIDVGVFVEPHPYGFTSKTGAVTTNDYLCCMPTIVTINGWETVEYITHQALGISDPTNVTSKDMLYYVVNPSDLTGADMFWYYLKLGMQHRGAPVVDATHQYYHAWIASTEYKELLASTPPLPCKYCMSINRKTQGAPVRPRGQWPSKDKQTAGHVEYLKDTAQIMELTTKSAVCYESTRYTTKKQCREMRKTRARSHRLKLQSLWDAQKLLRIQDKVIKGLRLTDKERKLWHQRSKNESNIRC